MKRVRCLNDLNDVGNLFLKRFLTGSLAKSVGRGKPRGEWLRRPVGLVSHRSYEEIGIMCVGQQLLLPHFEIDCGDLSDGQAVRSSTH